MPSYMQNIAEDRPETAFLDRIVPFRISLWKQAFYSTNLGPIGFGAAHTYVCHVANFQLLLMQLTPFHAWQDQALPG